MRPIAPSVVIALLAVAPVAAQTITVQSPNGGETWVAGTTHAITWIMTGPTKASAIDIVLIKGGTELGFIAQNVPVSPTSHTWTVGQYVGGSAGPGTNYKVGIREIGTTDLDTSDAVFKITRATPPLHKPPPPPVSLKVNVPNGGERWRIGTQRTITWSSSNLTGNVELVLVREPNIFIGIIASDLPPNGSHTWRVGDYQGGTTTQGQFRVRARWQAHFDRFDDSDQTFTLTPSLPNPGPPHGVPLPVRVPAIILNLYGTDSHPNVGSIPMYEIISGRPTCDAPYNVRARVGRDWFPYQNVQLAVLYRSRVHFEVGPFAARAGELTAARLRLKQVDSVRTGTTDASCGRSFGELQAPWTTFDSGGITNPRSLHHWESEYTVDITETVRKWLDGSLANHGLLLFAAESPMSNPWTCISCFEATFELEF